MQVTQNYQEMKKFFEWFSSVNDLAENRMLYFYGYDADNVCVYKREEGKEAQIILTGGAWREQNLIKTKEREVDNLPTGLYLLDFERMELIYDLASNKAIDVWSTLPPKRGEFTYVLATDGKGNIFKSVMSNNVVFMSFALTMIERRLIKTDRPTKEGLALSAYLYNKSFGVSLPDQSDLQIVINSKAIKSDNEPNFSGTKIAKLQSIMNDALSKYVVTKDSTLKNISEDDFLLSRLLSIKHVPRSLSGWNYVIIDEPADKLIDDSILEKIEYCFIEEGHLYVIPKNMSDKSNIHNAILKYLPYSHFRVCSNDEAYAGYRRY